MSGATKSALSLLSLLCVVVPTHGCAQSDDAPLMREIRKVAGDDHMVRVVDLHLVYGEAIPTASEVMDDLKRQGFRPTFGDPIAGFEYIKCGSYYLSDLGGSDAHLRRRERLPGDGPYVALLDVEPNCSVTRLRAGKSWKNTP